MDDRERLTAALADYLAEFGQCRWRTDERFWVRSGMAFIRAKKKHEHGIDEALVTARLTGNRIRIKWYVLLCDEEEWRTCDQRSFEGFLEEGPQGLKRGVSRRKATLCNCRRIVHRSSGRAWRYARDLAREYGKPNIQRVYECPENPRAFHLTAQRKGSREVMADAYIDLDRDRPGTQE